MKQLYWAGCRLPLSWPVVLLVMAGMAILLKLGFWQLDRAEQKRMRLEQIRQYRQFAPLSLAQVAQFDGDKNDLPVAFDGWLDSERYFLLDNKVYQGRVGYQLLQVAQLADGRHVLVNLGWLAAGSDRTVLPEPVLADGKRHIKGRLYLPPSQLILGDEGVNAGWPKRVQQIDLAAMSQWLGHTLLPYVVLLEPSLDWGLIRHWQVVVMPPEKHQAYALQWFLLALALPLVVIMRALRRPAQKKQNRETT